MTDTSNLRFAEFWDNMYAKQRRIPQAAEKHSGESLVSAAHHIDVQWMFAPPVKRVYIPKAGSAAEKRPIGTPTYEDKILQRAIVTVLEPILEGEFYDFSYGFRPRKSARHALNRLWKESMGMNGGYVIDMDISKYFDTIHPEKTRLLDFAKPGNGQGKGGSSFTFLGFTRYWTKSRKGNWMAGRKTDSKRLKRAIAAISAWCKANLSQPLQEQWEKLKAKITGHYAYYGISLNSRSISEFYCQIRRTWHKWLSRRGWKGKQSWEIYSSNLLKAWPLPTHKIMRSYC